MVRSIACWNSSPHRCPPSWMTLAPDLDRTLIVLSTEFGRVCAENGNDGTDHGHGGATWLMGGRVRGGRVYGRWTGLEPAELNDRRDLKVTTDFRDIYADVAQAAHGASSCRPTSSRTSSPRNRDSGCLHDVIRCRKTVYESIESDKNDGSMNRRTMTAGSSCQRETRHEFVCNPRWRSGPGVLGARYWRMEIRPVLTLHRRMSWRRFANLSRVFRPCCGGTSWMKRSRSSMTQNHVLRVLPKRPACRRRTRR